MLIFFSTTTYGLNKILAALPSTCRIFSRISVGLIFVKNRRLCRLNCNFCCILNIRSSKLKLNVHLNSCVSACMHEIYVCILYERLSMCCVRACVYVCDYVYKHECIIFAYTCMYECVRERSCTSVFVYVWIYFLNVHEDACK